jgi:hypothetical protein
MVETLNAAVPRALHVAKVGIETIQSLTIGRAIRRVACRSHTVGFPRRLLENPAPHEHGQRHKAVEGDHSLINIWAYGRSVFSEAACGKGTTLSALEKQKHTKKKTQKRSHVKLKQEQNSDLLRVVLQEWVFMFTESRARRSLRSVARTFALAGNFT